MEYPFGQLIGGYQNTKINGVLILLLVEYPFGPGLCRKYSGGFEGLNPSFSGISFRTTKTYSTPPTHIQVLILLLVEYPFGLGSGNLIPLLSSRLNPSFSGISFRTIPQ